MKLLKTVYDKLVANVNNIKTSGFVLKTKYDTDKSELEMKISDTRRLVKKTDYNTITNEIENKISSISGLATSSALTAVENKIPDVSSLVKKTDYNLKITEIEKNVTDHDRGKYITTPEFDKFIVEVFDARLAQTNLVTKTDFDIKLMSVNKIINLNKTKQFLVENELTNYKNLIQFILKANDISKKMANKMI